MINIINNYNNLNTQKSESGPTQLGYIIHTYNNRCGAALLQWLPENHPEHGSENVSLSTLRERVSRTQQQRVDGSGALGHHAKRLHGREHDMGESSTNK